MQYLPFFMKGDALGWYKWMAANHQISTWETFQRALELRFGPSSFDNHQASLFKLTQKGSVTEFQQQFETLSNRVVGMLSEMLWNCFISGLKPEIQRELNVLKPHSLSQAIGMAKLFKTKFQESRSNIRFQRPQPPLLSSPPPSTASNNSIPIKRVTTPEMQERHNKGLCYNCDDKYHPGHRCVKCQFLLLLADDGPPEEQEEFDVELSDPGPASPSTTKESSPVPDGEHFHLSTAALRGPPSPRTLRVEGRIQELQVTILIDSGGSHNIMQPPIAEFL